MIAKYPIRKIGIVSIEEIHKDLVASYAILELDGGGALQIRYTIQKKPFGWRTVSWENMGMAGSQ